MPEARAEESLRSFNCAAYTAFRGCQPVREVASDTRGTKAVCGVLDSMQVRPAAAELEVAARFFAEENTGHPLRMMSVVVILMDSGDGFACIHNRDTRGAHFPESPVVPPAASDGHWWEVVI